MAFVTGDDILYKSTKNRSQGGDGLRCSCLPRWRIRGCRRVLLRTWKLDCIATAGRSRRPCSESSPTELELVATLPGWLFKLGLRIRRRLPSICGRQYCSKYRDEEMQNELDVMGSGIVFVIVLSYSPQFYFYIVASTEENFPSPRSVGSAGLVDIEVTKRPCFRIAEVIEATQDSRLVVFIVNTIYYPGMLLIYEGKKPWKSGIES